MSHLSTIITDLIKKYPALEVCREDLTQSFGRIEQAVIDGGQILVCGNGGSHADADHIVTELMKSFDKKRQHKHDMKAQFTGIDEVIGTDLFNKLEPGIPAISLGAHGALNTAISNDIGGEYIFAQQLMGYNNPKNILIAISTSGNSKNIINALVAAQAQGITTIGLTGETGGQMKKFCHFCIRVPSLHTPDIQELHLPVYHALCKYLEENNF